MDESPGRADDPEGDLYDAYLDGALAGAAEDPRAFLARHPDAPPEVRARVSLLHRLARRAARAATTTGPADAGAAPAEAGLPRERVGEYRLLRRIGAGGMGIVFEAEQASLGRRVAVKMLRPDLVASPEARARFEREARAVARLRHPAIVAVHACGEDDGVRWIAMDLARGRGLDEVIAAPAARGAGVAPARAARWGARLARALEYAHARGVVHRDVKPSNVRIGPDDEPVLLDFGIARDEGAGAATMTGPFVGSLPWAAPEQVTGARADGRADVYGLGALLYHALTGRPPVEEAHPDRAIHALLHEDPPPPRRLQPAVPRDLDVVVRKAIEKDPDRRYATAGALAEDLEAVLDFRPVRARPPGVVRRLRAWGRARPAAAAGLLAAVAAAAALAGAVVSGRVEASRARLRAAAGEVAAARAALERFREGRASVARLDSDLSALLESLETTWVDAERMAFIDAEEDRLRALRRGREEAFHAAMDHLRRAEATDPAVEGVAAVRARLYVERWRDAEDARDAAAADFYRAAAVAHDPGGVLTAAVFGRGAARIVSDPPGAEVHLFRFREQRDLVPGGEPRLVPVPRAPAPVAPGAAALRVVAAAGDLAPGDLVLALAGRAVDDAVYVCEAAGAAERGHRVVSVDGSTIGDAWDWDEAHRGDAAAAYDDRAYGLERDGEAPITVRGGDAAAAGILRAGDARALAATGGVPARVLSGGVVREVAALPAVETRATRIPTPLGSWSLAGATPIEVGDLDAGWWLAVLRAPGREEARVLVEVRPGGTAQASATMAPAGSTPPGFVRVQPVTAAAPFRIMDREVTCAEYAEFLEDAATRALLDADPGAPLRFVPRNRSGADRGHWRRGADGGWRWPDSWRPDWPVLGISHEDAVAYAAWRTARDRPLGGGGTYAIPSFEEWLDAGFTRDRFWVFGARFRPRWVKSCFARPRALPEPVLRFPRDESVHGVFDMAGSVAEWIGGWQDEARGMRRLQGGSWAWAGADKFKTWASEGWRGDVASDVAGLRLVLRGEAP